MKRVSINAASALMAMSSIALAQGANDPVAQLRACSQLERVERLECLDRLSRDIAPPAPPAAPAAPLAPSDGWLLSETTSPIDYTPMVSATAYAHGDVDHSSTRLMVSCRNGRTELVVGGPPVTRAGDEYAIAYRINNEQPVRLAAGSPFFGSGAAFRGDVVRLLQSLPDQGSIAVSLISRSGSVDEATFPLSGLKAVREKVAAACKWPHAIAAPRPIN